ncbi:hypothetical protein M409DRAFT_22972 [Zasmidium cellare ATCC 36951]|uniref:Uncharacterized protein n=1 Tax=Zasmidium cellare ATCC 36951 TaxID=1080233 RepID=A0A6A6CL82_ZASCE|nr:uncharacterized protein M409DRAFT_22972 [Zasmidium cellare ATCC 36951]KAF2166920.1 hypothetical protein M409DRAFT_22972 [Zasmidium cellare ATCC 36951]
MQKEHRAAIDSQEEGPSTTRISEGSSSITTLLETRTKAFVAAINARDFDLPTSNSDQDPSPWKFLHSSFRADRSGLLSCASVDLNKEIPPTPSQKSSIDRKGIVDLFAYTAAKFPAYRMNVSNATTCLDLEEGSGSVFVNVDVLRLETSVGEWGLIVGEGKARGLVRRSVGEFE